MLLGLATYLRGCSNHCRPLVDVWCCGRSRQESGRSGVWADGAVTNPLSGWTVYTSSVRGTVLLW